MSRTAAIPFWVRDWPGTFQILFRTDPPRTFQLARRDGKKWPAEEIVRTSNPTALVSPREIALPGVVHALRDGGEGLGHFPP
jgi:hypothetical protein